MLRHQDTTTMKHNDTTLQAAIDAAMLEIGKQVSGKNFAACPKYYRSAWPEEADDRLDLAKAFLAKLPEAELAALKSSTIGILRPLSEAGPVPDGCVRVTGFYEDGYGWFVSPDVSETRDTHFADIRLPVAEATPKTEEQAWIDPVCGCWRSPDVPKDSPCPICKPADPYARLKAYAKAGARIRFEDESRRSEWAADEDWGWCFPPENYEVHPDDLHLVPEYAPVNEPPMQQVPLGPEDVMPGSILRGESWTGKWAKCWCQILEVTPKEVHINRMSVGILYKHLMYDYLINRSIPLTGKWDVSAWEPCYKMI